MTKPVLEAHGLSKSFSGLPVLRGVDLRAEQGSVLALLGPNGAGKTTLVRILSTLSTPDAGRATVAGFDVVHQRRQVRGRISLTGQYAAVDDAQTGTENLTMFGRLAGLSRRTAHARARDLLARFDLADAGGRRVGTYSGGMRRRLDLAASLVGEPAVIFLDEPTSGLDPVSRQGMWQVVGELVRGGTTVFLTTQYLEEADRLADRIALLDHGRIVAEGTAAELKARIAEARLDVVAASAEAYSRLSLRMRTAAPEAAGDGMRSLSVPTDGTARHVRALLDGLDPDRTDIASFMLREAALDDVFVSLTGGVPATDVPAAKEPAHV